MNCTPLFCPYNYEILYRLSTPGNNCFGSYRVSVHFKASKWQPDVVQPQLNTATFFRPCVKLFSENSVFSETFAIQAHHYIPSE